MAARSDPAIIVVEDEPDLLSIVVRQLRKWNFKVEEFKDPAKALSHFQKNHSRFSLLLTDIRLPGMTGLELAHQMLQINPEIKVLLMTAYELDPQDLKAALPLAMHEDVLRKPFSMFAVCNAIKNKLQAPC
jgi:CheY-like chemotaxis protein